MKTKSTVIIAAMIAASSMPAFGSANDVKRQVCIAEHMQVSNIWGKDGNLSSDYLQTFVDTPTSELVAIINICDKENHSLRIGAALVNGLPRPDPYATVESVESEKVGARQQLREMELASA